MREKQLSCRTRLQDLATLAAAIALWAVKSLDPTPTEAAANKDTVKREGGGDPTTL